ncbi:hypothetical protein SPACI_002840 [Sporomusa acidovorans DSM 3132]|uniref:Uncharacterized protein n=1 Tax=Sporomusa acidovorans (strain ATCC 49682 / DSM 3132 / Mol) TaxID=1123286 RepID=A0ABZ3IWR5_SPOA4|nr:hypothetical protein SPACI_04990 [Sporomusa acidovorans DSM 3132]SDE22018.1 hypothetical protein SAMN04488499_101023 [Sporomusa acidovorans]
MDKSPACELDFYIYIIRVTEKTKCRQDLGLGKGNVCAGTGIS